MFSALMTSPPLTIRLAKPGDALAVATVHVNAWKDGYGGLVAADYLDALKPEDRAGRYTLGSDDPQKNYTLVAELDGKACGFATTGPASDDDLDAETGAGGQ